MSHLARSRGAAVSGVVVALAVSACGSSSSSSNSSSSTTSAKAVAPSVAPNGKYVAHLTSPALTRAGTDVVAVGGGGVWHMSLTPKRLVLTAPPPGDGTSYKVVSVSKNRLTLAGNPECSVDSAKTVKSVYAISTSPGGLKFTGVKIACKEDGGSITAGKWTRP